jgi:hypothetical protein
LRSRATRRSGSTRSRWHGDDSATMTPRVSQAR